MIELEKVDDPHFEGQVWSDKSEMHVIVQETENTYRHGSSPGWYVRDENGESGPHGSLAEALSGSQWAWQTEVTLAPANRLRDAVEVEDENDVGTYLLEYLAAYGTAGIDAQALAKRVSERIEES
jgi:hypothetical protein